MKHLEHLNLLLSLGVTLYGFLKAPLPVELQLGSSYGMAPRFILLFLGIGAFLFALRTKSRIRPRRGIITLCLGALLAFVFWLYGEANPSTAGFRMYIPPLLWIGYISLVAWGFALLWRARQDG